MTQPASTTVLDRIRTNVDKVVPASSREALYRVVAAIVTALTATGALTADKAALWTQLGVSTVTLVFALLYAGTSIRTALYSLAAAAGGLILAYGILKGIDWAIIVGSVGQALGVVTAAAKAQAPDETPGVIADPAPPTG